MGEREGGRLKRLWGSGRRAWRWDVVTDVVSDSVSDKWESWRDSGEDYYDNMRDTFSDYWFDKQLDFVFGTIYYYFRYTWRRRLEEATSRYTVKTGVACVLFTTSVVTLIYLGKRTGYLDKFKSWWKRWRKDKQDEEEVLLCKYAVEHSSSLHPAQCQLIKKLEDSHLAPSGVIKVNQIHALQILITQMQPTNGIIIGVNSGYSSLSLALCLPEDGKLIVCDDSANCSDALATVTSLLQETKEKKKVEFINKPVHDVLDELAKQGLVEKFDFGLFDGGSENYSVYYDQCLRLLRPGGMLAFTDVLRGGDVVDTDCDESEETVACRLFNNQLVTDDRVSVTMLTFGSGLTILFKK